MKGPRTTVTTTYKNSLIKRVSYVQLWAISHAAGTKLTILALTKRNELHLPRCSFSAMLGTGPSSYCHNAASDRLPLYQLLLRSPFSYVLVRRSYKNRSHRGNNKNTIPYHTIPPIQSQRDKHISGASCFMLHDIAIIHRRLLRKVEYF